MQNQEKMAFRFGEELSETWRMSKLDEITVSKITLFAEQSDL